MCLLRQIKDSDKINIMQIDKNIIYQVNDYTFTNFINLDANLIKQVWQWRNAPEIRAYMYNKEIISLENHLRFVQSLSDRDDIAYWLVRKGEDPIGVTNLTDINIEESSAELGYYMVPSKLNSGLGLEFAYNNFLFVFDTKIQCNSLHGAIHRSNINALVLDSYLGCEINKEQLRDPDKEFISFSVQKDRFLAEAEGKNDMRAFISYVRAHRKEFQV